MSTARKEYVNIYGRKGGRGIRPLLLLPKVVSLAVFLGGYVSAAVLWYYFRSGYWGEQVWPVQAVSILFRRVIVPSLFATMFFGVLLFLQHPKVFIRRRWLQAKLVVVCLLPVVHTIARGNFQEIKAELLDPQGSGAVADVETACQRFSLCLMIGLAAGLLLVVLGRLKPRLGQKPKPLSSM